MNSALSQFVGEIIALIVFASGSTIAAVKITQAVINERLTNMKNDLDKHKEDSSEEFIRFKEEISTSMGGCRANHKERIDSLTDYVKRVEASKADKSEFNLVYDNLKRLEQKVDLLILRNSN